MNDRNMGISEKELRSRSSTDLMISAVIACYNDEQAIPVMYQRLVKVFGELQVKYEIIFVNNNSPDNTEEVLSEICQKDLNVIAVMHSRSFQSQSSFLSGMEISSGDMVVLLDGDLQDPPELIPKFFEKWKEGFDVVYGSRIKRDTSFVLNFLYKTFYRIFREVSYIPMPLNAGDFSLMSRRVVNEIIALPETDQFMRGLRAWVGFKQTGVDYVRPKRMFGRSTNNWHRNFWWAKKAIFSFSFIPLELLTYGGVFLTAISFIAGIFQVIYRLLHPELPHGVSLIIVLILFFGGIQLLAISIIGEYMAKVLEETKRRPKYIRKYLIYKGKAVDRPSEMESIVMQNKARANN